MCAQIVVRTIHRTPWRARCMMRTVAAVGGGWRRVTVSESATDERVGRHVDRSVLSAEIA